MAIVLRMGSEVVLGNFWINWPMFTIKVNC